MAVEEGEEGEAPGLGEASRPWFNANTKNCVLPGVSPFISIRF